MTWLRLLSGAAAASLVACVSGVCVPGAIAQQQDAASEPAASCTLKAGASGAAVRVIDAETIEMDDGQQVRIIGALSPRSPDLSPAAEPWTPEENAKQTLRELVAGKTIFLATSGRTQDRYGRRLAHVFIDNDGERVWVQGEMLLRGHARAYGLPGNFDCMNELLAHEKAARDAGLGLWRNGAYSPRPAWRTRELLRRRNSYEIVTGNVAKVATTKARTYINFGRDWRSDFTAGIEARVLRENPELAQSLQQLEGRRVEVRGWIQYRNGPYIDIEHPSQLAIVDDNGAPPTPAPRGAMTSSDRREHGTAPTRKQKKRPARKAPDALDL
ncbi:thermonuclease family protein [Hyphomicrobium sp. D-2]|uniref:thermonuclease family protein n=1 Tax=Hyphomicrobium sp. D-2 TaxID=3041621 RepID=UPI0024555089|nr:thermonuclease family protein [Hyphomicrobium sp. D-2]MDH4983549.1 thermonuclease family protein [Hyphomicrobium sp. D-2]